MLPEAYLTSIPALQNQGGFRGFVYVLARPIRVHDRICLDKIPRGFLLRRSSLLFSSSSGCGSIIEITATPWRRDFYEIP